MDEVELQWFQENSRRGLLATWSVVLMALGALVVIFAVIVGIAIGIQPGLRDETFAIVTAALRDRRHPARLRRLRGPSGPDRSAPFGPPPRAVASTTASVS